MAEKLFCKKLLRWKAVSELMVNILKRFMQVERSGEKKIKVGIVGEIYVKYSPLGNNNLEEFLLSEGCEVVCRACTTFCFTAPTTSSLTTTCTAWANRLRRCCAGSTNSCAAERAT